MRSSTSVRAASRVLLGGAQVAEPEPAPGPAEPLPGRVCSPAGLQRRPWLARLGRALAEDRFVVHYQPIVSLASGEVAHYEALVRLADDAGGLIAPACFLPAAERYGLVCQIDRMVVEKVLARLARGGDARVAVNLSALSVTDPGMLDDIRRRLARHRVAPQRLLIELTETASIASMERARDFCLGARALGCELALDDFGSGFGAFHYLKHLPFGFLKIDGGFIRALPSSPRDQLVVKALVAMARGMGMRTIAELVENDATLRLLARFGVDYAQGFHVGRPAAALSA
jgi:EAL domain-containing protein (putative c-di-GMP-specific phosphodiesterase class I)